MRAAVGMYYQKLGLGHHTPIVFRNFLQFSTIFYKLLQFFIKPFPVLFNLFPGFLPSYPPLIPSTSYLSLSPNLLSLSSAQPPSLPNTSPIRAPLLYISIKILYYYIGKCFFNKSILSKAKNALLHHQKINKLTTKKLTKPLGAHLKDYLSSYTILFPFH